MSPMFKQMLGDISSRIKGKRLNGIQRSSLSLLLNRAAMGYMTKSLPGPFDAVRYVDEEYAMVHPWSLRKRLFDYGYYQLDRIFGTPDKYLNTRPDLIELIKQEVNKGMAKRLKDDAAAANKEPGGNDMYKGMFDEKAFTQLMTNKNFNR